MNPVPAAGRPVLARARGLIAATLIGVSVVGAALPMPALARGPESLADLAEQVTDAVVNIAASTTVEQRSTRGGPQLPPGTPFEDLFEEFFNRRGGRGGGGGGGESEQQPRTQRKSNSLGSGFIIDASGIVVTNNHVIGDANDIQVILHDGTKLKAEIIGKDSKIDLAVLRVKPTPERPLKAVPFGDSEKLRPGDWVMAIGNPFGLGGSVSAGIVSARNRDISDQSYGQYIQTDAAINKGNSGGPLFNMDGDVIGINTAILSPSGGSIGIGFAVPSDMARTVVEQLIAYGETRRGWLGVRIQPVDENIAESLGLGESRGALIAGVDDKGPSKPVGIVAGDVIIRFDGRDIKESRDLPRIVGQTAVGKEVDVVVIREGKEKSLRVTLGRLEDGEKLAQQGNGAPTPEAPVVKKALGLELSSMTDEVRKRYSIKETVKGVVVTKVDPDSAAGEKRIAAGDVITEVQQEAVQTPDALVKRIAALKKEGKKSALFLVSSAQGDMRFVALPLE